MNLEEYLEKNCILTGSRAMGFERKNSDYDYAVTSKQVSNMIKLNLLNLEYTQIKNKNYYDNKLKNDDSFKFFSNGKEYNFIVYPTDMCLEVIENITKAVSCIPEAKDKNVRNNIFERLCELLVTDKVRALPEIILDETTQF